MTYSGIVHAGYDDKPGTNRAKYCWPGNQMFPQLDKVRFNFNKPRFSLNDTSISVFVISDDSSLLVGSVLIWNDLVFL